MRVEPAAVSISLPGLENCYRGSPPKSMRDGEIIVCWSLTIDLLLCVLGVLIGFLNQCWDQPRRTPRTQRTALSAQYAITLTSHHDSLEIIFCLEVSEICFQFCVALFRP